MQSSVNLLLTILSVFSGVKKSPCLLNWLEYNNACYLVSTNDKKNFTEANGTCQTYGAHLTSVSNQQELCTLGKENFRLNYLKYKSYLAFVYNKHLKKSNAACFYTPIVLKLLIIVQM